MLYIYLPVLYYHGNIYVTEEAYAGRRGCPLSQRSFLLLLLLLLLFLFLFFFFLLLLYCFETGGCEIYISRLYG